VKPQQVWTIDCARDEVDGLHSNQPPLLKTRGSDDQPLGETGTRNVRPSPPKAVNTDLRFLLCP